MRIETDSGSAETSARLASDLEPLPGSVVEQLIQCGKPGCRCLTGNLHGPYHYRIWREGDRVRKVYVPRSDFSQVVLQCAQHQAHADRLIRLVAERKRLSRSLLQQVKIMRKLCTEREGLDTAL